MVVGLNNDFVFEISLAERETDDFVCAFSLRNAARQVKDSEFFAWLKKDHFRSEDTPCLFSLVVEDLDDRVVSNRISYDILLGSCCRLSAEDDLFSDWVEFLLPIFFSVLK